ncbi:MAG: hypothetical protein EOP06_10585, partial [Proteobacteria bacterium]
MNKNFVSVYNEALGAWVAASEVTKSASKKNSKASNLVPRKSIQRFKLSALVGAAFGLMSFSAMAQYQITIGPTQTSNGGAGQVATNNLIRSDGSVLCAPGNSSSVTNGNNTGYNYAIAGSYSNCIIALANDLARVDAGGGGPVRYSSAPNLTTPNGGTVTNDVTLVGANGGPVGLHNVANGNVASGSTDAVNGGQLFTTNGNVTNVTNTVNNIMNGGGIKYYHTNSTANDSNAVGKDSTAFGPNAKSNSVGSIAGGLNASSSGNYTIALGSNSIASGA